MHNVGYFIPTPLRHGRKKSHTLETCYARWKCCAILLCGSYFFNSPVGSGCSGFNRISLEVHDIYGSPCERQSIAKWELRLQSVGSLYCLDNRCNTSLSSLRILEFVQNTKQEKMVGKLRLVVAIGTN